MAVGFDKQMKCKQCGNHLPVGIVYCEHCGKEVQIVPDFNVLDDEIEAAVSIDSVLSSDTPKDDEMHTQPRDQFQQFKLYAMVGLCGAFLIALFVCGAIYASVTNSYSHQKNKGNQYYQDGKYEEALACYEKALEIDDTKEASVYLAMGNTYLAMENYDLAIDYLTKSINKDPNNVPAYRALIGYYVERNDYDSIDALRSNVTSEEVLSAFDEMIVPAPLFSLDGGSYNGIRSLEIKVEGNLPIYYTLDGASPTVTAGIRYNGAIELPLGETKVTAVAYDEEKNEYSRQVFSTYHIEIAPPDGPVASPEPGIYGEETYVTLTAADEDLLIYYTMDGTDPTDESTLYTEPILLPPGECTISAVVYNSYDIPSEICRFNYAYGVY